MNAKDFGVTADQFEITDGYVSELGKTYNTATDESFTETLAKAARFNNMTEEAVFNALGCGKSVAWCKSPNYYYDHSDGVMRMKPAPRSVKMVVCDCGHSVSSSLVMSASLGTSCPDCYDRMSD